jgi:hypothetical protein
VEEAFGSDENAIGKGDGQRSFREPIIAYPRNYSQKCATGEQPQQAAADKGYKEFAQPRADIRLTAGNNQSEQDGEQRYRRSIVEQCLTFN